MIFTLSSKILQSCAMFVFLIPALSSCVSNGGGRPNLAMLGDGLTKPQHASFLSSSFGVSNGWGTVDHDPHDEHGNEAASSGVPAMPTDTASPETRQTSEPNLPTGQWNAASDADVSDSSAAREIPLPSGSLVVTGTKPGSLHLADRPRNNPDAADLLDHWGHRQSRTIAAGLSLTAPAAGSDPADLRALRTAAQTHSEAVVAPELHDADEVRILGSNRGITYGRWTGGPADTLSIEFDLSRAGPAMRDDPNFRAMLERAGKAWSHRIADTWTAWQRPEGDLKGWLISGTYPDIEIRVNAGGETSTGLEIDVKDEDLPEGVAGWASSSGPQASGGSWEPRFGSIEIDREHLREAGERTLFATLTHEIGHVLGVWKGDPDAEGYGPYTDTATGTWTGPNVVTVHGGPAPFQDDADPKTWVEGERDPLASQYDFAHSGLCASVMSYCRFNAGLPGFLPHAIDFAFLADLGMTVTEETSRPETYGLAGWTDHAGFTLSVSRDLQVALADPQPHYDGAANPWQTLDVLDLLQVGADAFGYRSTGDLHLSHPAEGVHGTVRYAGGLLGAALDRSGLPPVTGDANLAVDLGTLDGSASFTSLAVYPNGIPETFAGGYLHYPFELSDNAIIGTEASSTLLADFYGPQHEDIAGTLYDPRAGLLASFGASVDDRPSREDVIASADYLLGRYYQSGASNPAGDGWYTYRCGSDSACELRHAGSGGWSDWMPTTRDRVLSTTAGWDWRNAVRPDADHDFVRIARQSAASTDNRQGRHVVDSYTGTLEHIAFGVGFEKYTDWWTDSDGTPSGFRNLWSGFQGTLSGGLPDELARWSGPMLGYQGGHAAGDNPFVEGLATVEYSLSANRVDVAFSEVASRDGQRDLPDFGFEDLRPQADGTFTGGGDSGVLNGAFFGPRHEETAGSFHHNATHVTGSFGARRMPDTVTLEESGTTNILGNIDDGSGFYAFDDWGFWGKQFGDNIFGAFVAQNVRQVGQTTYYEFPGGRIDGTPSGHNPVSGSAIWSGKVRAFDRRPDAGQMPVSGNARLEVDFDDTTVDIDFTDFEAGHDDMSWQALRIRNGAFRDTQGLATIAGAFYGTEHQGAAGKFDRDHLQGVFGAVRN